MYLLDTNIFLEALLEQEKAASVRNFFQVVNLETIFMSDLSLHSIGIILFRLKEYDLFTSFLNDVVIGGIRILSLNPEELITLNQTAQRFDLDFDDAYQYMVTVKYELQLISFDSDFDRTEIGRMEPSNIER